MDSPKIPWNYWENWNNNNSEDAQQSGWHWPTQANSIANFAGSSNGNCWDGILSESQGAGWRGTEIKHRRRDMDICHRTTLLRGKGSDNDKWHQYSSEGFNMKLRPQNGMVNPFVGNSIIQPTTSTTTSSLGPTTISASSFLAASSSAQMASSSTTPIRWFTASQFDGNWPSSSTINGDGNGHPQQHYYPFSHRPISRIPVLMTRSYCKSSSDVGIMPTDWRRGNSTSLMTMSTTSGNNGAPNTARRRRRWGENGTGNGEGENPILAAVPFMPNGKTQWSRMSSREQLSSPDGNDQHHFHLQQQQQQHHALQWRRQEDEEGNNNHNNGAIGRKSTDEFQYASSSSSPLHPSSWATICQANSLLAKVRRSGKRRAKFHTPPALLKPLNTIGKMGNIGGATNLGHSMGSSLVMANSGWLPTESKGETQRRESDKANLDRNTKLHRIRKRKAAGLKRKKHSLLFNVTARRSMARRLPTSINNWRHISPPTPPSLPPSSFVPRPPWHTNIVVVVASKHSDPWEAAIFWAAFSLLFRLLLFLLDLVPMVVDGRI